MRQLSISFYLLFSLFCFQSCLYEQPGELDFIPRKASDPNSMKKQKFSEGSKPIENKKSFRVET